MIDIDQARRDILAWIQDFVETPRPELAGWAPCPYARAARLAGLLDIQAGATDPYADLARIDIGHHDVVILVYAASEFDCQEFLTDIDRVNDAFLLPRGLIALADHPENPEIVMGVAMNQGTYALAMVQNLAKLDGHARTLSERGYYQGWPDAYLQGLFRGRQDPRS